MHFVVSPTRSPYISSMQCFYKFLCLYFFPTPFKVYWGIVFTHSVQMGGRFGGWSAGKLCPGCISETIRCRKLICGRDIG